VINGLAKPIFDEKLEDLDIHLVETHPGQAVVFHDKLLHGGAVNMADTCRVSMELTMLVRR
jgi:ectoine hydroxylase-related dioxygenase (phytanoyl-CoA dioxygenase family)